MDSEQKIMKKLISILLLVAFSVNILLAQRSRPGVPAVYKPTVEKLEINDAANDFGEKGLPQPEIVGSNPSDELAKHLAKEISKYDENSLPILMATLQKAGFYIIDDTQKVLYKPSYGKGMGLAFYDFEVAGMYKLSRSGGVTSLTKMMDAVGQKIPKFNSTAAALAVLEGIRASTRSENPTVRFYAKLVVELGKTFPTPVDLMTVAPDKAQINLIQASLIERRLIGDFIAYATKGNVGQMPTFKDSNNYAAISQASNSPVFSNVKFTNASFFRSNQDENKPCDLDNLENVETDIQSTIATTANGKIVERILDEIPKTKPETGSPKMGFGEKLGIGLGVLNAVLSWAKVLVANSKVTATFDVEEPLPLVRTKDQSPGQERKVKAKFEMKPNNIRQINCGRLAINAATGLEFSMPSSGPMTDKSTSWELMKIESGDFPVYLDSLDRTSVDKQQTDGTGVTTVKLTGKPQYYDFSDLKLVKVPKQVKLKVSISQKNMKEKGQEAADLGALGLSTGLTVAGGATPPGWILLIVGGVPEMMNRMKLVGFGYIVPVQDWQPCSEDWGGFINVKREYSKTTIIKSSSRSNGNRTGDGIRTEIIQDEIDIVLNPRTAEEVAKKLPKKPADVAGKGIHSDITTTLAEANPCCGPEEGKWTTKTREGTIEKYSGNNQGKFDVTGFFRERDYNLSFTSNGFNFPSTKRDFKEVDSDCDIDRDEAYDKIEPSTVDFSPSLMSGRYAERVVNESGEFLFGQKEISNVYEGKFTWKWTLARCQK
jgi:hypothetical protein